MTYVYVPRRPYDDVHKCCTHKKYTMTCEEYDELRAPRGNNVCTLCEYTARYLVIDHDHAVGWHGVRGLICSQCNTKLSLVDHGKRDADDRVRRYFANAWHLTHRSETWARDAGKTLHPIEEDR